MEDNSNTAAKKINRTRKKGDGGVQETAPGKFRAFLDSGTETVVVICSSLHLSNLFSSEFPSMLYFPSVHLYLTFY